MPSLAAIADERDAEAESLEDEFRTLALLLFALELAILTRAIARAETLPEVLQTLRVAEISYRAPNGFFRQQWRERFGELLREAAARPRPLPVVGRSQISAPSFPPAAARVVEEQAEALARDVVEVTVRRVQAVRLAVADAGPTVSPSVIAQRLETLVPLVGREAAAEIIRVVQAGREAGQSIRKVATSLVSEVHATETTKVRATRIARTESIGLLNSLDHERALSTGVLREKRWLHQRDGRVRDSHIACGAQGWIPIGERFSNGLQHPHERPAPPEEVINCRCSPVYRA
jgi:hypothetical protein